jgi:hypothetical protein
MPIIEKRGTLVVLEGSKWKIRDIALQDQELAFAARDEQSAFPLLDCYAERTEIRNAPNAGSEGSVSSTNSNSSSNSDSNSTEGDAVSMDGTSLAIVISNMSEQLIIRPCIDEVSIFGLSLICLFVLW